MEDHYTQFSPPRQLRKVKRLPLTPRRVPDLFGQEEPLNPTPRDADDKNDDMEKREKAYQDLVAVWQQRLQLMTAIATFFASTESGMLSLIGKLSLDASLVIVQAANASFLGGMIIHVFVAFIAFFASFLLVDYRIHETETEIPRGMPSLGDRSEKSEKHFSHHRRRSSSGRAHPAVPANPRLVQVGPFKASKPPVHLLGKCYSLCVTLASIGFILTFLGVCCFAWSIVSPSVSIFASVCVGLCLVLSIFVFCMYDSQGVVIKVNVDFS